MIRYFCDACGKECDSRKLRKGQTHIYIPEYDKVSFDLCIDCYQSFDSAVDTCKTIYINNMMNWFNSRKEKANGRDI